MYHMNKKQETNAFVKECITTALLQMMKKKKLDDIKITELIVKAGVSRNSFYRNFDSKKDILDKHLIALMQEWGRDFEDKGELNYFYESLLKHYYKYKDFYLMLYRQGLSDMIYETIRAASRLDETSGNIERYLKSMLAGLLWGLIDEWMRQGMPESPEEIILLAEEFNQKEASSDHQFN